MIKMKSIGMRSKIALIAVAAVCLLIAPALSVPSDRGAFKNMQDGKLCLMGNMTPEEMGNMTLGELKEMREQAWNNSTACPAGNERQDCNQRGNRMMARDGRMGGDAGKDGAFSGRNYGESRHGPMGYGFPLLMQMDDLTADELNNMTLNQIKELQQKKMQELGNMTLNEISELRQEKMEAQNNMTLNELMAMRGNMPGMGGFMGAAHSQGQRARG
jgi:hypothetical protein